MYLWHFDTIYFKRVRKAGKKGVLIKFKWNTEEAQKCIGHFKIYVKFSVELLLLCERKWANYLVQN